MIQKKTKRFYRGGEAPNFWVSYSDLMAGMLLVFILLLSVAMFHYAEFNQRKEKLLQRQEQKLASFHQMQRHIIQQLAKALIGETVTVDPQTGTVQIGSGILFGEGEAELQHEGRKRLAKIFDAYVKVILDDRFRQAVKQIEIEGHTNSNGTYLYNLELSQQRALAVMKAFLARAGTQSGNLQQMVVAGGRSFTHLVRDSNGLEDPVKSRRIEIKFRLKEEELFSDIYRELAQ